MEIQYTSSRREVWAWYWRRWLRGDFIKQHLYIGFSVFAGVLLTQLFSTALSSRIVFIAFVAGVLSVSWFPVYPLIVFKAQPRTLRIDRDGLSTAIGKRSARREWSEISAIEDVGSVIYILLQNGNGFIVPRRAFLSDEQQKEFLRVCRDFHGQSEAKAL